MIYEIVTNVWFQGIAACFTGIYIAKWIIDYIGSIEDIYKKGGG